MKGLHEGKAMSHHSCYPILTPLLLLLLLHDNVLTTTTTAGVVEQGRSAVFMQQVEVMVDGVTTYNGSAVVEVSRYLADTLLILTTRDTDNTALPLVSGHGSGRALVVKSVGGRITTLLHHADETTASLNYKRSLASLLTPAHHTSSLTYHIQADVLGTCEVHYENRESTTVTWRDLTRCSHFSLERALGGHHLPFIHLIVDLVGSSSHCKYRWRNMAGDVLEGVQCMETLLVAPRYTSPSNVLNITLAMSLTHTATAAFNPAAYEYLQEATETTDLLYQPLSYQAEGEDEDVIKLMKEVCSIEGDGRLTGGLLQKMSQVMKVLSRTTTELPLLITTCSTNVRRMVALMSAIVAGPRSLHFFVAQLAELSRYPDAPVSMGEDFLFTFALRSLVSRNHHSNFHLFDDFFLRRENQMVYEELVDFLLQQNPPAVAGVAALLEGLKDVAPQLFERLLQKSGPHLSPEASCENGDHAEAVRLLRSVCGLSVRPVGYVASLRPCFANDNVDVVVAAMDTLATVDCSIQGVTELQKLGLESPSDPEIRIAAYRGLIHCIPLRPHLLQTVTKALDPKDDNYSTQVASYVWSHVQSVISSDNPSLLTLRELLATTDIGSEVPDPVWYDPRQHSRHLFQTIHLDIHTAISLTGDLVWGRYSPAPRAFYFNVALHHNGDTHELAQIVVRVTGMEAMLLSIPGVESFLQASTTTATHLWSTFSQFINNSERSKREIMPEQIADFIQQVMSRIPAEYRTGSSSLEVSLHLLGTLAFHTRLADIRYSSLIDDFARMLQEPIHAALLVLVPLLDNTLILVTSSGVPVALHLSGVAGFQTLAHHHSEENGGLWKFVASGGVSLGTSVVVGQQHSLVLESQFLWSFDFPVSAAYEYEDEAVRVNINFPEDWKGRMWQRRRDTSLAGKTLQLRLTQDCLSSVELFELCLDIWSGEDTLKGSLSGPEGWLAPYAYSMSLQMLHPLVITTSASNIGGAWMIQMAMEGGSHRYDAIFVLQLLPSPSFGFTLNSPRHTYYLKGLAGSREGITQVAALEFGVDRRQYGIRFQLSMPQLEYQKVWSLSAFITSPDIGEEEVVRAYLSWKEENYELFGEFSFTTQRLVEKYLNLRINSEIGCVVRQEDGLLRMLEIRALHIAWPGKVDLYTSAQIYFAHYPQGQGSIKIGWGEDMGEVEVTLALGPVVTFEVGPQFHLGAPGGTSFKIFIGVSHKDIPGMTKGSLSLLLDSGRVDMTLKFDLAERGKFSLSHTYNAPWNFKTSAIAVYVPLDMAWGAEHEVVVREDELRHWLNVSWSALPSDKFTSLIHFVSHSETRADLSLRALLMYPGQVFELQETLAEALGGSYKNKLTLRLHPGRALNMDTIIITRANNEVFSYGLSNTLKLDSWISPVSLVGTFNCFGKGQCSIVVTAEQAGDELLDMELQHTTARGISRTEAKIIITHWFDGTVSLDTAYKIGYCDLKWYMLVWKWKRLLQGRAEVDFANTDVAVAEMQVQKLLDDGQLAHVTHAYNGTFNLDHEARTLHVRQEVRVTEEGMSQLWTGVVQGQAGHTLFNSRHFAKATLTTPTDVYYTADGDISSAVSGVESVIAAISLSAGSGSNTTYLLMWDLDLQQSHSSGPSMVDEDKSYMEDIMEENDKEEWLLFYLETLLRASTPATGELKLNIEAKKTLQLLPDKEHMPSEEITTDIKVITETMPELGRILGKLTRSVDAYTFNGRMWSEQQAVGIVSYGMARNNSLKSSHLLTVVDPTTSWGRLQLVIETDHLGSFPDNFQSSIGGKGSVGMEEAGQVRALVLRTPAASSITLALITYLQELPGGSFFLKWSEVAVQSHITWALMKCTMGIQWQEGGKAMELVLNYVNPSTALHALDTSITFSISQAPYPPLTFILASRVSVNADHHYILNIDCRSQQEQYMITWAFMHPGGGGSVRLQLRHVGDTYGVLAVIVLQGFSLQVTGAFTSVAVGEELLVTMYSSLLKDPRGRTIRIFRKSESGKMEIAAFFSLSGDSPDWIYSYRLLVEMERDIKQKVRYLKAEDRFTYYHLHQLLNDYQFLILTVYNNFDEVELELEFPNFGSQVKVIGSLLKGKDSQLELVINTPSFTHLIDGRLIFGSSEWWSAHSGTFNYNLQKKKGRENPFKLKLEASKWNSNRQKYKFFVQKTHLESSVSSSIYEMLYEYPYETYNHPGYSYDDSVASTSISTFDVAVDVSRDPGTTEYKATWQTDKTKNEVRVVLEKDASGGGALLRYFRQVKGIPKSEVKYQLKGNYRRIDTELTISCTLDQSSITRPRAIIFLHSEAECYAELLLDLFEEEADQVILVITYFSHNLRFRIGQFGNTFLQLGYQEETDNEGTTLHKVQVESSGRTVEVWVGMMPEEQRTCIKAGVVLETPTLAPTHHLLLLCPAPTPELTIQLMGLEEHEGPYVRMGQISGPGGVGVQVGSGRLQPLDTPPALTLTADVEKEVLEILIDWQSRSLAQFKEEFVSRGRAVAGAVWGLHSTKVRVEGALGLWPMVVDTHQLLQEAFHLTAFGSTQLVLTVVEIGPLNIRQLLQVSDSVVKIYLQPLLDHSAVTLDKTLEVTHGSLNDVFVVVNNLVKDIVQNIAEAYDLLEDEVSEAVETLEEVVSKTLRPPLLCVQATLNALTTNDDQSLYTLASRVMGEVQLRVGRHQGIFGFLLNHLLTGTEKVLVRAAHWDDLRAKGSDLLHHLRKVTTLSVVMPHNTALKIRVATPQRMGSDLLATGCWFKDEEAPRMLAQIRSWLLSCWSRLKFLLSWHIHGEAVVFGWEQAITWDGRQVTPLLTDSCHHLLVLLTHVNEPTAITIHMEDLSTHPRQILSFFSGTSVVTLDSNLKMTYNFKHIRRPFLEVGELSMRWSRNRASVATAAGLSLECERDQDLCRLAITGDHFAATAGLLGVFDFDNNTDFMTSGWEIPATEEEWAQSWRVSTSEQCSSQLPESHIPTSHGNQCTDLFHAPASPFRSCFISVPASPYLESCRAGWECAAEAAYLHACSRHYHTLHPNLTCTTCSIEGHEEQEEEGTVGLTHEVVVITDFECFDDLQDLVSAFVKDYTREHRVVVRYIGRGSPPFGPFEDVDETIVDNGTPPLDAAINAATLDFSERALKSIVVFDCDHPRCAVSISTPKIVKLRETLLTQGIQLHVVTMAALTITSPHSLSKKATRQLIGLDGHTAYLLSHARKRKVKGKRNIREHIVTPIGNTCTQLAVETDGSVFSLQNIKMERKYHRRIFQQLLALRVEEGQEAEKLKCRRCMCGVPCTLCAPPTPLVYSSSSRDELEEEEDYEDEEEEEQHARKKTKKHQRSRWL